MTKPTVEIEPIPREEIEQWRQTVNGVFDFNAGYRAQFSIRVEPLAYAEGSALILFADDVAAVLYSKDPKAIRTIRQGDKIVFLPIAPSADLNGFALKMADMGLLLERGGTQAVSDYLRMPDMAPIIDFMAESGMTFKDAVACAKDPAGFASEALGREITKDMLRLGRQPQRLTELPAPRE